MRDFLKNKIVTVLIVVATVILAGVAVFSAIRLYQIRSEPATPVSPKPIPAAEEKAPIAPRACQKLTFEITAAAAAPLATSTPVPTITPTPILTPRPEDDQPLAETPTPTIPIPTATPTQIAQATPTPTTQPELPEAGVSLPTLIIISTAIILIILSLVLAL